MTLVDSSSAKVTLSTSYATADASRRTKAITIVGNTYSAIILQDFRATSFNINGATYQISGNTLARK